MTALRDKPAGCGCSIDHGFDTRSTRTGSTAVQRKFSKPDVHDMPNRQNPNRPFAAHASDVSVADKAAVRRKCAKRWASNVCSADITAVHFGILDSHFGKRLVNQKPVIGEKGIILLARRPSLALQKLAAIGETVSNSLDGPGTAF